VAKVTIAGRGYEVEVHGDTVLVDGHEYPVSVRHEPAHTLVTAGGVQYRVQLPPPGERTKAMAVSVDYRPFTFEYDGRLGGGPAPREARTAPASSGVSAVAVKGAVSAQIAGRVIRIAVKPGQAVARGDLLLILEAMKMENEIKAPADGVVKEVLVKEGDRVAEGAALVVIE
jgi:biotin carboxyl carrier protein